MIGGWGIFCKIALRWMSMDLTDDKSTLVQVMAWCRQAPSHYLSQCWHRYMWPYDVTRPQWVEEIPLFHYCDFMWLKITVKSCNISYTVVGNKIVDHSDVVGASPVDAAPMSAMLQLHLHSQFNTCLQWIGQWQLQDETRSIYSLGFSATYIRDLIVSSNWKRLGYIDIYLYVYLCVYVGLCVVNKCVSCNA